MDNLYNEILAAVEDLEQSHPAITNQCEIALSKDLFEELRGHSRSISVDPDSFPSFLGIPFKVKENMKNPWDLKISEEILNRERSIAEEIISMYNNLMKTGLDMDDTQRIVRNGLYHDYMKRIDSQFGSEKLVESFKGLIDNTGLHHYYKKGVDWGVGHVRRNKNKN